MLRRHVSAHFHEAKGASSGQWSRAWIAITLCVPVLAGCGGQPAPAPTVAAVSQVTVSYDDLIGNWGLASYRADVDRPRTEVAARSACSNPYVVTRSAAGGVMMYLADRSTPQQVILKTAEDGSVYIGPPGRAGDRGDRQVLSYDKGVMITRWVDPDVAKRYGTMVFVRCTAA